MPQKNIINDILLVLAVLSIIFLGYYTFFLINSSEKYIEKTAEAKEIGMNQELSTIVDSLNNAIEERYNLNFVSKKDPLDLTQIIVYEPPDYETQKEIEDKRQKEKEKQLTLFATIIGEKENTAVFRFKGKSIRVREGDTIDNKKVKSVKEGTVILQTDGKEKVYTTK